MDEVKTIYLGAGCFWNAERVYGKEEGVTDTEVGWVKFPLKHENGTSKVEVVKVTYDPSHTDVEKLMEKFWEIHDATHERNKNPTYVERSMIFATSDIQLEEIQDQVSRKKEQSDKTIYTEVRPFTQYKRAPEKDQNYY